MSETLDPKTRETLRNYVREVKSLGNEAAKRARFAALIAELFPGTSAVTDYARGVEKLIRISRAAGDKKGFADAYYGNAIIEFEKSLSATLAEAQSQLREYVAGTWQKDRAPRSLLAIASDGVNWKIYRPVLAAGAKPAPETVALDELLEFRLTDESLGPFWLWLTSVLFRPQQIEPVAERFQLDFGTWSPLYRETMAALKRAWAKVNGESEAKLAFETWQKYLTVTYGRLTENITAIKDEETAEEISELENLFLRHTYLASIARLLIWAALSKGKADADLSKVARDVISGRYFQSKRLANLVDDDFFHWIRHLEAENILAAKWQRILSHLIEYDLSKVREDVLKGVYQQLIDPKDRHDLGEYYTPDWLCERIVSELLPKHGYKAVLDPSCGSGSFLRAIITHFSEHNPEGSDNQRLKLILSNVQGIDIHPVAVTISRATYILALGKLVNSAKKPIQIPVYLADSLFLPQEVEEDLYQSIRGVEITYGGKKNPKTVVVPQMLIHSPELFDEAVAACTAIAEEHAKTENDTRVTMTKHLAQVVPELSKLLEYEKILDALWEFTEGLAELIRDKDNSIWSFIIRNSYRPAMLKERFDFIIGNPPWLSYRYISDPDYQDEIKQRAIGKYRIAPKSQKLFTQMELATVFLAHSMGTFANSSARLGFVMPRSVLSSEQHQNLILRRYSSEARFKLTGYWDLWDVTPLFNVPACVLFAKRDPLAGNPKDKLPVKEWRGKLPGRDVPWERAKKYIKADDKEGRVIYLGSRAALSTAPGARSPAQPSKYQAVFKNGATIYPRSFFFVRVRDLYGAPEPETQYWTETDPEQARDAKPPYDAVKLEGFVSGRFLFSSSIAKHVVPYAVLTPATVALPLVEKNGQLSVVSSQWLMNEGYREFGVWIREAERIWLEKSEQKLERMSLLQSLDYQAKLSSQRLSQRHLVLYNATGKNVSAAYFDRESHSLPFVVDHKLYWAAFSDPREAHYVVAVLNSDTANQAIKPFQSTGLLGERDIHKKLLDLPIPLFDKRDSRHVKISELGAVAGKEARKTVTTGEFPINSSLASQRGFIRAHLKAELKEIDKLVAALLG